mmetsp:Transcript_80460/g.202409  ORF Transcript_80460/g.202409 Transcript_80460/m.202409 type:complete len:225 (+) Transcript_80460:265-939(+)
MSCSARSEIERTSRSPLKRPMPASSCGCVAASSFRFASAIFSPSSDEELFLLVSSPRCRAAMRFESASTWLLFCTTSVNSCVKLKFSLSFSSRCASSCSLPRLLADLKWLMSLSWVLLFCPCPPSAFISKSAALSVRAVSCWSHTMSSRPMRISSPAQALRALSSSSTLLSSSALCLLNSSLKFLTSSPENASTAALLAPPCLRDLLPRVIARSCEDLPLSELM